MNSYNNSEYTDRPLLGAKDGSDVPNNVYSTPPGSILPSLPIVSVSPPKDDTSIAGRAGTIPTQSPGKSKHNASKELSPRPTPSAPKTAFMWFSLSKISGSDRKKVSVATYAHCITFLSRLTTIAHLFTESTGIDRHASHCQ